VSEIRNAYKILIGKPEEKKSLGDLEVDWKVMLQYILKK
jgi:hypothetical protein